MPLPRTIARQARIIMPFARFGTPDVLTLGRYNYTRAHPALRDHAHPGIIEICYLVRGVQNYRVGGRTYRLRGGDVFVTQPGERHSTGDAPEEKGVLYWLTAGIRDDPDRPFLGLPRAQGTALRCALLGLKPRLFRGSRRMQEQLDAMTTLHQQRTDPLRGCAVVNLAVAFLLDVVASGRRAAGAVRRMLADGARQYIHAHLDEPLTVPALAAPSELSVARFKTRFKEETGVPPGEFVLRVKVEEAQRRLATGQETVTEIAFALGFSTSQYFATVFKRFTGETPRAHRSAAACGASKTR